MPGASPSTVASGARVATAAYCTSDDMLRHVPDEADHVERPARLLALRRGVQRCVREHPGRPPRCLSAAPAQFADVAAGHTLPHLGWLHALDGQAVADGDLYTGPGSRLAVLTAAGCALACARAVARGDVERAYAVIRPPGHHAQPDQAAGFCYVNNAVLAALQLVVARPGAKVAIVDVDVHYHRGTRLAVERVLAARPALGDQLRVISVHRFDDGQFYPHDAEGAAGWRTAQCLNVAFPGPFTDAEFRAAVQDTVVPALQAFGCHYVVGSYGYDAVRGDPLGGCTVEPATFGWLTTLLRTRATPRLVLVQEGGYHLAMLEECAYHVMTALL